MQRRFLWSDYNIISYKTIATVLNFTNLFFSIYVTFLCFHKAANKSIDSDLKSCSNFVFYSAESVKLQENLNSVNRNTCWVYFGLKFFNILSNFSSNLRNYNLKPWISPNAVPWWQNTAIFYFCHLNVNDFLWKTDKLRDITNYIKPRILSQNQN